jgi:hypothetical protein
MEEQQETKVPTLASFFAGLPWVIAILVFSYLSWLVWPRFFKLFMDPVSAEYAALGMGPQAAFCVCLLVFAGNWPFQNIEGRWARGISLAALAIVITALHFLLLASVLKIDLETWAFPIIATSWFILAATSFVGAEAHLPDIPVRRRMFLNLLIIVAGTLLITRTIIWVPPFWFGFAQIALVSGGFAYLFRRVKQPTYSILCWMAIALMTSLLLWLCDVLGYWDLSTGPTEGWKWMWNIGLLTSEFGVFFALTCGFNLAVNASIECWPFSRVRQPWGPVLLLFATLIWCALVAWGAIGLMQLQVGPENAIWQATILCWQTVLWNFAWVFLFGVGQTPYLWAGQKTPGTWEDVDS